MQKYSTKDSISETDVLIVGGGLVGGCLAAALADTPLRVCIVDHAVPEIGQGKTFDGRAFAVSLSNKKFLDAVGLWDMLNDTAAPIRDIRVSDGSSRFFLHFDHQDVGDEPMGFMVENRYLRQAILSLLRKQDRIKKFSPNFVKELSRDRFGVLVRLSGGQKIRARLVVGADGRESQIRKECDIGLTSWNYDQTAIVCTVQHARSHRYVAQERFLPSGPFAILPLHGDPKEAANRSSIVWTECNEIAPSLMALSDEDFLAELSMRFQTFLGDLRVVSSTYFYPLKLQFAQRIVDCRTVLIGDASHSMHPIAGQGLNMGLRDAAALAEVLIDSYRLGLDIGDDGVLREYRKWRSFENTLMIATTDSLNRLFSNNIAPLRMARDVGLAVVNSIPPVKRYFIRHAMGLTGNVPKLSQGRSL